MDLKELLKEVGINKPETVILSKNHFTKLTDQEFRLLWQMPYLTIILTPQATKYVQKRRRALGLRAEKGQIVDIDKQK